MPNKFNIPIRFESMVPDFPEQTVVMARKLGLLRQQKFCSRTRAKVAAGASKRVCGECPTQVLILIENQDSISHFFSLQDHFGVLHILRK